MKGEKSEGSGISINGDEMRVLISNNKGENKRKEFKEKEKGKC